MTARYIPAASRTVRCVEGAGCSRLNESTLLAQLGTIEVDGNAYCPIDASRMFGVTAWGLAGRKGASYASTTPPDLASYTSSGSWAQNNFSASVTYDVMVARDAGGVNFFALIRETGANLRNATTRQTIVDSLRAAAAMYAEQVGRTATATTTFYRRAV